jgi:MFS family permease
MVYPTLLAAIGDVAHPRWRASAVGVYRLWRDSGFAVGALLAGVLADMVSIDAAIWTVAVLTAASGGFVAVRMYETYDVRSRSGPRDDDVRATRVWETGRQTAGGRPWTGWVEPRGENSERLVHDNQRDDAVRSRLRQEGIR